MKFQPATGTCYLGSGSDGWSSNMGTFRNNLRFNVVDGAPSCRDIGAYEG